MIILLRGQQEYNIGVISGASLFQGFKYTGVQEYQISGNNNIIIMSCPRNSDSHEYVIQSGIRGGNVRSRVMISGPGIYTT